MQLSLQTKIIEKTGIEFHDKKNEGDDDNSY
jgi:hypothetical protein